MDIGANLSNLTDAPARATSYFGLYFGLGTHIQLSDRWSLMPEFKPLSIKGTKGLENPLIPLNAAGIDSYDTRLKMNYLEIPVLLQRNLGSGWAVAAGPQLGFLMSAQQITDVVLTDGTTTAEFTKDISEEVSSIDISIPVEVAYSLSNAIKGKAMDIKIRYTPGLSEVFESAVNNTSTFSTFQFFLSFPFVK